MLGYLDRTHSAKDPRFEWACKEDGSNDHGESKEHALSCETVEILLGLGDVQRCLSYQQVSLSTIKG